MELNNLLNLIYSAWWIPYFIAFAGVLFFVINKLLGFYESVCEKHKSTGLFHFCLILAKYLSNHLSLSFSPYIEKQYKKIIAKSGLSQDVSPEDLFAIQLMSCLSAVTTLLVGFLILSSWNPLALMIVASLAWAAPLLWVHLKGSARMNESRRDLPYFIDFLALVMASGHSFDQGVKLVVSRSPKGLLRQEFHGVVQRAFLGVSKSENIGRLKKNIPSKEVSLFTNALLQAIKSGSGMSKVLLGLSRSLQSSRFNRAEEEAGKISVRMILPITIFILPAAVLILLGPMVIEWLNYN